MLHHLRYNRKAGLSLATVKRVCKSLKEKKFITWIKSKYVDRKIKTNHYTINDSSLRAVINCNQVSKRTLLKDQSNTPVSVTVSDNNLNNNLSNNLSIITLKSRLEARLEPRGNLDETPPTPTPTTTTKLTKVSYSSYFLEFWENIPNKVSKGIVEKNFLKLEQELIEKPEELAKMYKTYYNSIVDKQFAKQPAFWLSAKKYLDEKPKKQDTGIADPYVMRLKMFKDAKEAKKGTSFIKSYAQRYSSDVKRAIGEGQFTKDQAKEYLEFRV